MVKRFLIWCSGADVEILGRCPTDTSKYVGLGGAVLTTAVLALVSFTFAARTVLGLTLPAAVLGGLFWAVAIFNLDRWLVSALKRRPTFWGNVAAFLPRFVLAVLLGTVISEPLVLRIFQPEIEQEVVAMVTEDRAAMERQLLTDPRFVDLPEMEQRIADLNTAINGGIDSDAVMADPEVVDLTERLAAKEGELTDASIYQVCEIQGACGTGVAGIGPAAAAAQALEQRLTAERDALVAQRDAKVAEVRGRLSASIDGARAAAQTELATLQPEFEALTAAQAAERTRFTETSGTSAGLLARMEALHRLGEDNGTMWGAQWLLRLFIIAIDAMPVLVKFLMALFPPSAYEKELEEEEAELAEIRAEQREEEREIKRLAREAPLVTARHQRDLELQLAQQQAKKTVESQGRIFDALLASYERDVMDDIAANPSAFIVP